MTQKLIIALQDGNMFTTTSEDYTAAGFATQANAQGITALTVGGAVINKDMIKYVVLDEPLTEAENTNIQLMDGTNIKDYVATYNPADIAQKINDPRAPLLAVGSTVINKRLFKVIEPIAPTNV